MADKVEEFKEQFPSLESYWRSIKTATPRAKESLKEAISFESKKAAHFAVYVNA